MIYEEFITCHPGTLVTDGDRTGRIIKFNSSKDKALVRFSDGFTEWIEFFKIEIA